MRLTLPALAALTAALAVGASADEPAAPQGLSAKVEYTLKTARARDPVLGGARDKAFVSVWVPDGVKVVRGGICNPFSKGDAVGKHWQAACRHWQFAYVQTDFDAVKKDEFALLNTGLADLARQTNRPELEHLPLCFTGMSRGGGMSMQLAELMPDRTVAAAPVCLEVGPTSDATRRVPVLTVFGEKDGAQMKLLLEKLPAERKRDARFGVAVQWNRKHEFALANNLSFVFFDDAIAARVPKRPVAGQAVKLNPIALEDGWLGDVSTWGKDGQLPAVAAWNDYRGDRAAACWFPTARTAAVWRAFVGASKEVVISEPPGLGDGQPFVPHSAKKPVAVRAKVADGLKATKVELWDGDRRLATKTEAPWAFEVPLDPGVRALIVTATAGEVVRSSRPHTIVVGE